MFVVLVAVPADGPVGVTALLLVQGGCGDLDDGLGFGGVGGVGGVGPGDDNESSDGDEGDDEEGCASDGSISLRGDMVKGSRPI